MKIVSIVACQMLLCVSAVAAETSSGPAAGALDADTSAAPATAATTSTATAAATASTATQPAAPSATQVASAAKAGEAISIKIIEMPEEPKEPAKPEFLSLASLYSTAGVNVGIGAMMTIPSGSLQSDISGTVMPYASWRPLMLLYAPETRKYCATKALTLSRDAAADAADAWAQASASQEYNKEKKSVLWEKLSPAERKEEVIKRTGWEPGLDGSCALSYFGVYAGYPVKFSANTTTSQNAEVASELTPWGSAGLVASPWPYLEFLVGIQGITVPVKIDPADKDSASKREHGIGFLLGIGGTTDIFTKIVK